MREQETRGNMDKWKKIKGFKEEEWNRGIKCRDMATRSKETHEYKNIVRNEEEKTENKKSQQDPQRKKRNP
jgi:hypothetical protein